MIKNIASISILLLTFTVGMAHAYDTQDTSGIEAKRQTYNEDYRRKHNYPRNEEQKQHDERADIQGRNNNSGDSQIVAAAERRGRVDFVEGSGMVVTQLLPDDNSGLRHQKWMVKLSNGQSMQAVYNSDMCPRVPLKVGDVVAMGGQFIYTNEGPMLHWLHFDPKSNRPDGYVEVNGQAYCKDGPRH